MIYHLYQKKKIGKVEKRLANFYDNKEHIIHIRILRQALNHGLVLQKCI